MLNEQLPQDLSQYIVGAAEEVIDGKWDSQFPLVVKQVLVRKVT